MATQHRQLALHRTADAADAPHAIALPTSTWRMLATGTARPKLPTGLDAAWSALTALFVRATPRTPALRRRADRVLEIHRDVHGLNTQQFRQKITELRVVFRRGRERPEHLLQAYALVREAAHRALGLLPHPEQVMAALALADGCVAEMATGEGKTLAATLPATLAGWRGRSCHVVTVNDYLARRDARWMEPIYRLCGLRVAHIEQEMDRSARRAAYAADITYCTNKEVTADFLRDRLRLGHVRSLPAVLMRQIAGGRAGPVDDLLLRGLECAIIDEADSILIDEAVTPLIISGEAPNAEQVESFVTAARAAGRMEKDTHYRVNDRYREVELTDAGRAFVDEACGALGGVWAGYRRRDELIVQALTARELFLRDRQYVVMPDDKSKGMKIVIVDESTGRLMPDRTWRDGLHQAIEAKERITVNAPKETYARVSFQRFFRLYRRLCGMTGTAAEADLELWQVYHLPVAVIPTHRPCIRGELPDRAFRTAARKWEAVIEEIKTVHATGRPILVGTRNVAASELLSARLSELGLAHSVLNAVRHAEEAAIVSGAGQRGSIMVATNMAGRGTDIKLGAGVAELGGLHVIATERHESRRVDRQLFGRCGRQGDPGSALALTSLEDELPVRYAPTLARRLASLAAAPDGRLIGPLVARCFDVAQKKASALARRQRKNVVRTDDWIDETLGFTGREI